MTIHPEPTWVEAIEGWALAMRAGGLAASTIKLRREQLSLLARWAGDRGPWELMLDDLLAWQGSQERWGQERRRSVRTTLRRFYTWGVHTGRTTENPALRLDRVKASPPNPRPTPDPVYKRAKLGADARTILMIRLAADAGLRRNEVAQIHSDDLEQDLMGWSLNVHGKGGKPRTVPLDDDLAAALRALPEGYAFPGNVDGHLSAQYVGKMIAGLLGRGWGMHSLRHRFASEFHEENQDTFLLQETLGHASPETTRRYVRLRNGRQRAAVAAVARRNRQIA
jgi:integrase